MLRIETCDSLRIEEFRMVTKDLISEIYRKLIAEGAAILEAVGWDGQEYPGDYPDDESFFQFRTEAMNLVRRSCGDRSDHYRAIQGLAADKTYGDNSFIMPRYLGVVRAAQRDFDSGLLFDIRSLIAAELLGDFLEQAGQLLREGYHVPAASLAGAVLEDSLRKLSTAKGIAVPDVTKIDVLNAELARAQVYDKLVQKRIIALADIRNNADHGHFDKFKKEDVEDFVKWLQRFAADYLK